MAGLEPPQNYEELPRLVSASETEFNLTEMAEYQILPRLLAELSTPEYLLKDIWVEFKELAAGFDGPAVTNHALVKLDFVQGTRNQHLGAELELDYNPEGQVYSVQSRSTGEMREFQISQMVLTMRTWERPSQSNCLMALRLKNRFQEFAAGGGRSGTTLGQFLTWLTFRNLNFFAFTSFDNDGVDTAAGCRDVV